MNPKIYDLFHLKKVSSYIRMAKEVKIEVTYEVLNEFNDVTFFSYF